MCMKTESMHLSPRNLQFVLAFPWTPPHASFHNSGSYETLVEVSMHKYSAMVIRTIAVYPTISMLN